MWVCTKCCEDQCGCVQSVVRDQCGCVQSVVRDQCGCVPSVNTSQGYACARCDCIIVFIPSCCLATEWWS